MARYDEIWNNDQRKIAAGPSSSERGWDFSPPAPKERGPTPLWVALFVILGCPILVYLAFAVTA